MGSFAEETFMSGLPTYTTPGSHLGTVPSFELPRDSFGTPEQIAGSARTAYSQYQIVTGYAIPFMFDAQTRSSCCVFLPPFDQGRTWMVGGELRPGQRMTDELVRFLEEQAGIQVAHSRRSQFLWVETVELQRHVEVLGYDTPMVRHELARISGYAMQSYEMDAVKILGLGLDDDAAREYWLDVLEPANNDIWKTLDPALRYIVERLVERLAQFHTQHR
jgi:hypothetical protein